MSVEQDNAETAIIKKEDDLDAEPVSDGDDDAILEDLLEKRKQLEYEANEKLQKQLAQDAEDAKNNFNIFETWMKNNITNTDLYKNLCKELDAKYRTDLFEDISEYFMDDTMVSSELVFYWKFLIVALLKSSKKYRGYMSDLVVDTDALNCNLSLVKEKSIFRCFLNDEPLCYFKENGNDYYVS